MVTWDEESSIQFNDGGFMNEYWAKQRRPTLYNPYTRIAYVFQGEILYEQHHVNIFAVYKLQRQ